MSIKKKTATAKKSVIKPFKWLVVWNQKYGDYSVFTTDDKLSKSLGDSFGVHRPQKIYRLGAMQEFKYEAPALVDVLKEVK